MVNDGSGAAACSRYFGSKCLVNKFDNKSRSMRWFDASVLNAFSRLDRAAINSARSAVCV